MPYFYKGYEFVQVRGKVQIYAPMLKGRLVKETRTMIEAKIWVESVDNRQEILRSANEVDKMAKEIEKILK